MRARRLAQEDIMTEPIGALHRYFIWANRMRHHLDEIINRAKISPALDERDGIETFLYMSYWYGGLYVVVEGWRELDLHDQEIDGLVFFQFIAKINSGHIFS